MKRISRLLGSQIRAIPAWFWRGAAVAVCLILGLGLITSCAPSATPGPLPTQVEEEPSVTEEPVVVTAEAIATPTSAEPESGAEQPEPRPTQAAALENWLGETEWPAEMRRGESDIVRLKIMPDEAGYTVTVDFPEHQAQLEPLTVRRPPGYLLTAVARLEGVNFAISPYVEQAYMLQENDPVEWVWTISPQQSGQQRLSLTATFRWTPAKPGGQFPARESVVYARGLDVQVHPPFPTGWLFGIGLAGLALVGLGLVLYFTRHERQTDYAVQNIKPDPGLRLEPASGIQLSDEENKLLQALFHGHRRLMVEEEFLSGYSGARTLLVLPIQASGRQAARSIIKIGTRQSIQLEYANYQSFVKRTLPPVTSRIQQPPVGQKGSQLAALQYTFISATGSHPKSLRLALLEQPVPDLIYQLFETLGSNWWMQRHPYTFHLGVEYDRMLPSHLAIQPASGEATLLDGHTTPVEVDVALGSRVILKHFPAAERRADGKSWSLRGSPSAGFPPLRIRWQSPDLPSNPQGRVVATRAGFLQEMARNFDHYGMPDPLERLPDLLQQTIQGTRSIIHGDLNLENILIGPGGTIWLIDFAQTREGHTLYDFAHLYAEIVAHILSSQVPEPGEFLEGLQRGDFPLLGAVKDLAGRCLFDPAKPQEFTICRLVACLGALKFDNISTHARHLLYLAASFAAGELDQQR
jgi:hypothetical protein